MKEKVAVISILVNAILAGAKIAVGLVSTSTAVLAEGLHSFMDVFSSIIGFLGIKISQKPGDEKHPYGHYKFEVIAGLFITLILFGTGLGIIYEAYRKFLNPTFIKIPILAFGTMIFSGLVNEAMARVKIHYGEKENSIVLLSDGVHSRVDVFTSLAVFAGLFLTRYWVYADSVLAFFIGVYVIRESFSLGKTATDSLLDVSAGPEIEEKIKSIAEKQGIRINSLRTQKKGSVVTANLEITLPSDLKVETASAISGDLRKKLMKEIGNLSYVAIQIKSHEMETGFYKPAFGHGFGWQRKGRFRRGVEAAQDGGPDGYCVCPKCGYKIAHERGIPCSTLKCPKCNINLVRR
jgi:cation diffusion facilitator family transporter